MKRILMRTLTRKSVIGFGHEEIKDLTVQMMLDLERARELMKMYFSLSKINFTDDILNELGITDDLRIEKPTSIRDFKEVNRIINSIEAKRKKNFTDEERIREYSKKKARSKHRAKRNIVKLNKKYHNKEALMSKNQGVN